MRPEDLKQSYSESLFLEVNSQLLETEISKSQLTISPDSSNFITATKYYGNYDDLDLHILSVEHSGTEDARVGVSMDIFKLMKKYSFQNALVAAHSKNSKSWRYSLVTSSLSIDEKGKITKTFSNPRRYSFVLGPNQRVLTPYKQLIQSGKVSNIKDLSKRFSLEVVNNEFYKEIAKLYDELVGTDIITRKLTYPKTGDESHEFAVRLIGRIIFCWFLREKKSKEGISLVPAEVLSRAAADEKEYYHNVLAPLFFEVLNRPLEKRNNDKFKTGVYADIPYLNGGLFSDDSIDHYKFDKSLGLSIPGLVNVPNAWLHGLFDLLERYNFTVDENTSYDTDLSIDPEMLGRVFENLLARINPETGETVRKSTGSFYTPREIVDYMVDTSLSEYLVTKTAIDKNKVAALISYDIFDDLDNELNKEESTSILQALSSLTVIDPACGSGAFPIGMLQKIVFIITKLDPDAEWWLAKQLEGASPELRREFANRGVDYIRKLGVIRQTIFGVDIQPIATEISRLRCFLTLIVDEVIDDAQENRGIRALPNLEFKFVTANSLLGLPEQKFSNGHVQQDMFDSSQKEKIEKLKTLINEYFSATASDKSEIKAEYRYVQNQLWNDMHKSSSYGQQSLALTDWDPFDHLPSSWFDPEWMFGIELFDIIIANPPYLKERDNKHIFDKVNDSAFGKKYHQGKMDYWYYFLHKAIDIVSNDGIISYITSRYWLNSSGAKKLISRVSDELCFVNFVDIGKLKVFDVVAGQHMVATYKKSKKIENFLYKKLENDVSDISLNISTDNVNMKYLSNDKVFSNNEIILEASQFKDKDVIELSQLCDTSVGVQESPDKVSKKQIKLIEHTSEIREGDGVFVLSKSELDSVNPNDEEKTIIKHYLDPNDVYKYRLSWHDKYLIYSNKHSKELIKHSKDYINLKQHFDKYEDFITSSNRPYGLHRARDLKYFENPKIIFKGMFVENQFTYDEQGHYVGFSFSLIIQKDKHYDLKYILAILNSSFALDWFYKNGKKRGAGVDIGVEKLRQFPIKKADTDVQKSLTDLVDEILSITQSGNYGSSDQEKALVKKYEDQIDETVYKIYELTPEEIDIIEKATSYVKQ